jgi:hypothetical protein
MRLNIKLQKSAKISKDKMEGKNKNKNLIMMNRFYRRDLDLVTCKTSMTSMI